MASKIKTESESLEALLTRLEPLWLESKNQGAASRLLRLALLRELTRAIHTLRSEFMATDRSPQAGELAKRENFFTTYFPTLDLKNSSLMGLFEQSTAARPDHQVQPIKKEIPEKLTLAIGDTKLTRQDRKWELEIAQEALNLGWEFWQFEASAEIHDVERFARSFSEFLWPHGVVLFVESDGFLKMSENNPNQAFWRGRWILAQNANASAKTAVDPTRGPKGLGAAAEPKWQRLYPLKSQSQSSVTSIKK